MRIWDGKRGEAVEQPLVGYTDEMHGVAVSADGNQTVARSVDKILRVWDAKSGKAVAQPSVGHAEV